jgi:hypothetical protein
MSIRKDMEDMHDFSGAGGNIYIYNVILYIHISS